MATGDIRIDALLALPQASLAMNHSVGKAVTITYSFSGYTAAQAAAVTGILNEISSVAGITFKQVAQNGLLTYVYSADGPTLADGSPNSGYMKLGATNAEVHLNPSNPAMLNLDSGYGRMVALHETLHALGFKHPGIYSSNDSGPVLPPELATAAHTVMAYNGGNSDRLGDFDVLTLQYLYGGSGGTQGLSTPTVSYHSNDVTTGTYFNDIFQVDMTQLMNIGAGVIGGAGTDTVQTNVSSTSVRILPKDGYSALVYTDGKSQATLWMYNLERIQFTNKAIAFDETAAQAYRLYEAAFNRKPDLGGLGYWINQMDKGASLESVAQGFINSSEFKSLYGAMHSNSNFITALYQNILDRTPDQGGFDYWNNQLQTGALNDAQVLASFSESNENKIALSGIIQNGIEYFSA